MLVVDEVGVGTVLDGSKVDPIPLSSFMSDRLHSGLDLVAFALGDSSLKARHKKEVWGVPWDAAGEVFLFLEH